MLPCGSLTYCSSYCIQRLAQNCSSRSTQFLLKPNSLNRIRKGEFQVVLSPSSDLHLQTLKSEVYDPSLSGELKAPVGGIQLLPMGERKVIAHRAFFEIPKPGAVVNLGVGMPEVSF